jgi:hypothetical protein
VKSPCLPVLVSAVSAALTWTDVYAGTSSKTRVSQTNYYPSQIVREKSAWTPAAKDIARQLDTLHNKVEEWGTVTLSSFVLAPPLGKETPVLVLARDKDNNPIKDKDGFVFEVLMVPKVDETGNIIKDADGKITRVPLTRRVGTFEFSLGQSAQDYFNLAGTAEGTAQNSLRILQQFSAAATAQFLPEETAQYANQRQQFLKQQTIGNEVQNNQLDAYRANLARAQQSHRLNVEFAQTHLDEAQRDVQRAETRLASAQNPEDLAAANASLTTAKQTRDAAQTALNNAIAQPVVAPEPPAGLPTSPTSYPTVNASPMPGISPSVPPDMTSSINDLGRTSLVAPLQSSTPATANFSTRARVIDAASNKAVQEILNFIGNPMALEQFRDKTVIFAISEVALNPGWRTKKDYSIRLDLKTEYRWAKAHAETIRRLVHSNLYPLSVREAIANSNTPMLQQEDRDFLAQQRDYLNTSKDLFDRANKKVKDIRAQLNAAIEESEATAAAVKVAREELNRTPGTTTAAAAAALKQAEAQYSDAESKKQSQTDKLKAAEMELSEARRQGIADGTNEELLPLGQFCQGELPGQPSDDISVAAVSPLMDTQNLDETSSYARQDDLALFLSASLTKAGLRGQAQAYERYIKQRRQDIATRSSAAVANTYSFAGGIYGFQIGPRLRALANPEARKSGPAQTLDKQTFPALILFGVTPDDLRPVLLQDGDQIAVYERQLRTHYTYRWLRTQHYFWPPWKNKRKDMPTAFFKEWASNQDLFTRRRDEIIEEEAANVDGLMAQQRKRYEVFNSAFYGAHHQQTIPSYFLVPDRFLAMAQVPRLPSSQNQKGSSLIDLLPTISTIAPNLPAIGTGTNIENPIKLPGKVSAPVTPSGTAKPVTASGSFSVMIKGSHFDSIDVTRMNCVSPSVKLNAQTPPKLVATDLLSVSLDVSEKNGDFTLIMPFKTDREHEALIRLGTQLAAPTLTYYVDN